MKEYGLGSFLTALTETHKLKFRQVCNKQYTVAACKMQKGMALVQINRIMVSEANNFILINDNIVLRHPNPQIMQAIMQIYKKTRRLTVPQVPVVHDLIVNISDIEPEYETKKSNGFIIGNTLFFYTNNYKIISAIQAHTYVHLCHPDTMIVVEPDLEVKIIADRVFSKSYTITATTNTSKQDITEWHTYTYNAEILEGAYKWGIVVPRTDANLIACKITNNYITQYCNCSVDAANSGDVILLAAKDVQGIINNAYEIPFKIIANNTFATKYNLVKGGWRNEAVKFTELPAMTADIMNKYCSKDQMMTLVRGQEQEILDKQKVINNNKMQVTSVIINKDFRTYAQPDTQIADGDVIACIKAENKDYKITVALTVGTDNEVRGTGLAIVLTRNKDNKTLSDGLFIGLNIAKIETYAYFITFLIESVNKRPLLFNNNLKISKEIDKITVKEVTENIDIFKD